MAIDNCNNSLTIKGRGVSLTSQNCQNKKEILDNSSVSFKNSHDKKEILNNSSISLENSKIPESASVVTTIVKDLPTPVKSNRLDFYLQGYNLGLRKYLITGFKHGFHLNNINYTINDNDKTLQSARNLPSIVDEKLSKEISLGRIVGPFDKCPYENPVISPLGLREKKTPGEYRVIHHLSYPHGSSVNDGIPKEFSSVHYTTISQAIMYLVQLGSFTYMAKSDIKSAFRIVPIHPDDYHLLGMKWNGKYYFDHCLPMGASSSCLIFEKFSTALNWVIDKYSSNTIILHVLDDFLFLSKKEVSCNNTLDKFLDICNDIGVPIAPDKTFRPTQFLQFLGIDLDTKNMTASIPADKIHKFITLLEEFLMTKSVTLRKLQSLTGMLNFACGVIAPARAFSRRLYNLSCGVSKPYHHVKITREVKLDLLVWRTFLTKYNSKTFFLDMIWKNSNVIQFHTDASTTIGYGGVFKNNWFAGIWEDLPSDIHINIMELYPICVALHLWGPHLANQCIELISDNMSIVYVINKFSSKDNHIMTLLRQLVLTCMNFNILLKATHLSGKLNIIPDLLSRNQVDLALKKAPHLNREPVKIPAELRLKKLLGI